MPRPTLIDLFCGVGGLSNGFANAGFTVLGGNDNDPAAMEAFAANHPRATIWPGDVRAFDAGSILDAFDMCPGELDVLAGGPPCQGFSRNRANRHVGGRFVEDPRNYLFRAFLELAAELAPKVVVIENVPEILTANGGVYGNEICERLGALGYRTTAGVLHAVDFGVPQKRRRAIIIASTVDTIDLPEPTVDEPVTVDDAIGDLAGLAPGEGSDGDPYPRPARTAFQQRARTAGVLTQHHAWTLSRIQTERVQHLRPGHGHESLPTHLRPRSCYGSAYGRLHPDRPSLTITTQFHNPGSGMFFHHSDDRTITVREAARLQSFTDDTVFIGNKAERCRQVGNAVPPLVAEAIARSLLPHLNVGQSTLAVESTLAPHNG